jgi:PAS domain S-box-containing protein
MAELCRLNRGLVMSKGFDFKVYALTVLLTIGVIAAWEVTLRPQFFAWVDTHYPGDANVQLRWNVKQRFEHFFISVTVDLLVVTMLLRLVHRQQRQLRMSEERYRTLFEQATDGIGLVRLSDYHLLDVNKKFCQILGQPQPQCGDRDIRELFRTVIPPELPLNGHSSSESEMIIKTAKGQSRPISVCFTPLLAGGEEMMIMSLRDLSVRKKFEAEREEMQRQLYQSSKLASIGELSAGVAHEINNPLNGVINFAQLLKDEERPRSEFEEQMIDGIIEESERIAQIVRGLLTFARADPQELRQVHFADAIKTSIALFGRQFEKDGIVVEIDLEPDLPLVHADSSRLRQVVVNMISNAHHALKAKEAESQKLFRISARRAGEIVRVEFFDNGIGIRREDLNKVFDPFFTTRRETGGTGLGLSISFGIVRDFGGAIKVESEEGEFTRFVIELAAIEYDYVVGSGQYRKR